MAVPIINSSMEHEAWTADEFKIIQRCHDLCDARGMKVYIVCQDCYRNGKPASVLQYDNSVTSNRRMAVCSCKRRVYEPPSA